MSKRYKILTICLSLICLTLLAINYFGIKLPEKVKAENILKITPGMSLEKVVSILGDPLRVKALNGIHKIGCLNSNPVLDVEVNEGMDIKKTVYDFVNNQHYCCEGNKEELEQLDNITLVYTYEHIILPHPMLWVHLDRAGNVSEVYAKKYEGFFSDDPGIYGIGWEMDSTMTSYDHTKVSKWLNDKLFFESFK